MNTFNVKGKVEFCLKTWEKCRNDDEYLYAAICSQFYSNLLHKDSTGDICIKLKYFNKLPSMATVIRVRQKFQECGIYQASHKTTLERDLKQRVMYQEMNKHVNNVIL